MDQLTIELISTTVPTLVISVITYFLTKKRTLAKARLDTADATSRIEEAAARLSQEQAKRIDILSNKIEKLETERDEMSRKALEQDKRMSELEIERAELKARIKALEEESARGQKTIDALREDAKRLGQCEAEVSKLEAMLISAQAERDTMSVKLRECERLLEDYRRLLDANGIVLRRG